MASGEVAMTVTTTSKRPTVGTRRAGYAVALLINAVLLYAINVWPGWEAVPFLTVATTSVIGWVNFTVIAGLVANLILLVRDPLWFKALADMFTTTIGLIAAIRIWQVFPFDFGSSSFDWALVVRILLVLGIVGSAIGIIAAFVSFVRSIATGRAE